MKTTAAPERQEGTLPLDHFERAMETASESIRLLTRRRNIALVLSGSGFIVLGLTLWLALRVLPYSDALFYATLSGAIIVVTFVIGTRKRREV